MTLSPERSRNELGDFLRRRREALSPEEAGIPTRERRRTPGLRRDEVAERANVSVIYYQRLERGVGPVPSPATLRGIARALQLTPDESDYLYSLVGQRRPPAPEPEGFVDPGLRVTMDQLAPVVAAAITDEICTVLAQNTLNAELFGPMAGFEWPRDNIIWRWFTEPAWRDWLETPDQHEDTSRFYVSALRPEIAQRGYNQDFVDALRAVSDDFATMWDEHTVATLVCTRKKINHGRAGQIELECTMVLSPNSSQRLLLGYPAPGTDTAERLAWLNGILTV